MSTLYEEPLCQELATLSAQLGADRLLIQAAGGNTSIKDGDTLWVKASGLWLSDALKRAMFVPVRLSQVRAGVVAGVADPVSAARMDGLVDATLRPSIETTLHALMPHPVVLHVHAVDAIAWSVQPTQQAELAAVLQGVQWAWVPYARPGLPLTHAVAQVVQQASADVLLMANHGLVVGGDSLAHAQQRLHTVLQALHVAPRKAPDAGLAYLNALTQQTSWRLPQHDVVHAIATDACNRRRAQAGVLYPDHVVFLGTTAHTLREGMSVERSIEWLNQANSQPGDAPTPPFVLVPDVGVLVRRDLSDSAQEMLACWAEVLQRLPIDLEPSYVPPHEAQAIANWEAEKFRVLQNR